MFLDVICSVGVCVKARQVNGGRSVFLYPRSAPALPVGD